MTLTRKLALALCLVFLFTTLSSNSQVDSTTGNLINYGTTPTDITGTWNNGVYVNQLCFQAGQPGNCGPNPSIRPGGVINFSYGTTDLNQIVNINRALSAGGTGVQLSGFNFGFMAKNGNGWDDARQDYLAAYVKFYNAGGGLAANYDYSSQTNQRYNWTQFNFSETFAGPIAASNYSNAQVGFVGRDNNFWAGNYGPEIYNVSFSLKYRVDPCALNPAYSPNCAGFKDVSTSSNLVPSPNGYAVFGDSINQSYAINTALASAGSGAVIHGFQWGYVANANGPYCAAWLLVCWDERTPSVNTSVSITNSSGATLYSVNRQYENSYNTKDYSYLFPTSQQITTLGNFNFTASTNDSAYVGSMYSRALYTADPCAVNPLSSPTCSGYGAAYAKLLSSTSTTSSTLTAYAGIPSISTGSLVETSPIGTIDQSNPVQQTQQSGNQQQGSQPPPPPPPPSGDANPPTDGAGPDPAQPGPTPAGPAPSGSPAPAGSTPQATQTASSSSSPGPSASSAGPSKLAMSVVKTAQANDKATQTAAVQNAAKTLENAQQSSQASSNLAISLNQDMSANSATAAATFASQTTQASTQVAAQTSQGSQQTSQSSSTQTSQASRAGPQAQQQQQDSQQVQLQSAGLVQAQAPQQQEAQQAQTQSSTSVVKLLSPPQEDSQQTQTQSTSIGQYQPPKQQETQQAQTQSSTSVVKLLSPQQQEPQQAPSQMTAGTMPTPQPMYTAPVQQDTQNSQVAILKPPAPMVVEIQQSSSGTGITVSRNLFAYNPLMASNTSNMSAPLPAPQPVYQPRLDSRSSEVEAPQYQMSGFTGSRAGNPLSEIMMQERFEMMQDNIAQPASSVNRNALPNELAGGVDIASIANVPSGFGAYSFVLRDSAFYEIKEVYKNQRTVDNERVLRGLTRGSDSLHQQMVDRQYKTGN